MVRLCERENETYAVTNLNIRDLLLIEGRKLVGVAGQAIDNLFTRLDKRRCELIGETILGQESANGSWSGNLGLLQRKQALMYIKTEAPIVQASWLKLSMPVLTESFVIIQDIGLQKNEEFNLIQNLNFGIRITSLFLSLSIFSIVFIFFLIFVKKLMTNNVLTGTKCSLKKVVSSYLKINKRFSFVLSSMSIFIVMFHLYLWLFHVMITNSTQTNKVVIDTSEIVQDVNDALKSERTFCLLEDDTEYKIATLASKDNAIRKIFDNKPMKRPLEGVNAKSERCLIEKSQKSASIDTKKVFTIIAEQSAYVAIAFIGQVKSNLLGWFSSEPVYLQNLHIYHVLEDDAYVENVVNRLIKILSRPTSIYSYSEGGLFVCLLRTVRNNALLIFNKENRVYFSIKEFIEDMTKFDNLSFGNFRMVFAIFFSFCLILLAVFMVHLIVAKVYNYWLKRSGRRIRRRRPIFRPQKAPDLGGSHRNALGIKR